MRKLLKHMIVIDSRTHRHHDSKEEIDLAVHMKHYDNLSLWHRDSFCSRTASVGLEIDGYKSCTVGRDVFTHSSCRTLARLWYDAGWGNHCIAPPKQTKKPTKHNQSGSIIFWSGGATVFSLTSLSPTVLYCCIIILLHGTSFRVQRLNLWVYKDP